MEYEANYRTLTDEECDQAHLIASLENAIESLSKENDRLSKLLSLPAQPLNGEYYFNDFIRVLFLTLKRSYGWQQAYISASKALGRHPVSQAIIKKWMDQGIVPAWAMDQISRMQFKPFKGGPRQGWSDEDRRFLLREYKKNDSASNCQLANVCSAQFNRPITENAIRGAITRLRSANLLPPKRTNRDRNHSRYKQAELHA